MASNLELEALGHGGKERKEEEKGEMERRQQLVGVKIVWE